MHVPSESFDDSLTVGNVLDFVINTLNSIAPMKHAYMNTYQKSILELSRPASLMSYVFWCLQLSCAFSIICKHQIKNVQDFIKAKVQKYTW